MNTATIRQRLHQYLETAEEKKIQAIYSMLEAELNAQEAFVLSEAQLAFIEEERTQHLREESTSYSWEEVKNKIKSNSSTFI